MILMQIKIFFKYIMNNLIKKYLPVNKIKDATLIPPVLILLLLLFTRPRNISMFMGTLFGKIVMLVCIIIGTAHNTILGLLIAVVFVVLTDTIYEGFDLGSLGGKKKNGGDNGDDDGGDDNGDDDGGDDNGGDSDSDSGGDSGSDSGGDSGSDSGADSGADDGGGGGVGGRHGGGGASDSGDDDN